MIHAETITYLAPSIRAQGAFYDAMGEYGRRVMWMCVMWGPVAGKTLTTEGHAGKVYELNGPEAIAQDDLANRIAAKSGRK